MSNDAMERFKPEPDLGFDHEKSVEIIGFFLSEAGKPQDKLKLIKLIYLADRLSMERRGKPLNFDSYYSLPHGPIASSALNGMNQMFAHRAWAKLAIAGDNRAVSAVKNIGTEHLSVAETKILAETWKRYGHMNALEIRDWTHKNCDEYVEVKSSRLSIDLDEIFEAVKVEDADGRARELKALQRSLGRLARACGT